MDVKPAPVSRFIVDPIFPCNELHIVGGPAQSGKTTLICEIASDLTVGHNIFGYPSHRIPFCYISCVHSAAACRTVASHMENPFPIYSFVDNGFQGDNDDKRFDKLEQIHTQADRLVPGVRLIFIDGLLGLFDGSINDNSAVGKFLRATVRYLQEHRLTVIATGRAAKPKEASNGFRSIDRFLGATAWTEFSSTFISIEPLRSSAINDGRRTITLMPKHAGASFHHYKFSESGRLIETVNTDSSPERIELFAQVILLGGGGVRYTTQQLMDIGGDLEIPTSTMRRYLQVMMKQGRLKDGGHGWYETPEDPTTVQ